MRDPIRRRKLDARKALHVLNDVVDSYSGSVAYRGLRADSSSSWSGVSTPIGMRGLSRFGSRCVRELDALV